MKRILFASVMLVLPMLGIMGQVDSSFYIYLCFGQSNMEGNAKPETIDSYVDNHFRMLSTCNFDNPKRTTGTWYTAKAPIVNPAGGLGMSDYFGRTLLAALPKGSRVCVVAVAMGGSPIEMFDKDKYEKKLEDNPNDWWAILAKQHYGGNPYKRLIDMALKAKEVGVIKGILLHQGCSNNGDPNWPTMVKKIYNDMLTDLDLKAEDVPLFVGETLRQDQGGACYGHNTVVAKMPRVVPTSHVISSEGCPGNGTDPWHFSAMGYRIMGKRYAYEALKVMGLPTYMNEEYQLPANMKRFLIAKELSGASDLTLRKNASKTLSFTATYMDGHSENVTSEVQLTGPDFLTIKGTRITASGDGVGTVTASYTDFTGAVCDTTFTVVAGAGVGISDVTDEPTDDCFYNMLGQRVAHPVRGLYIWNGKKYLYK